MPPGMPCACACICDVFHSMCVRGSYPIGKGIREAVYDSVAAATASVVIAAAAVAVDTVAATAAAGKAIATASVQVQGTPRHGGDAALD